MKKSRKAKTRHLNEAERLTDEHLLRLAKQAVKKAKIPPGVLSYDECLSAALFGIANGYKKFQEDQWRSTREWLSMQALYQIRMDAKKAALNASREITSDCFDWTAAPLSLTPLEDSIESENTICLETLLKTLPQREEKIVRAVALGGESFASVARRLRLPRTQVIRTYRSALRRLRQIIESSQKEN